MAALGTARNLLLMGLFAVGSWTGCGGSSPEPSTPESAADDKSESPREDRDEASSSAPDDEEAPAARRPGCDDGTCTLCGDSQCPTGWYCDESAKGGPACGWLPECAKKPTCACLKRVFSGGCEERSGGLYVKQ
jgi:hypothetical protein